MLLSKAYHHFPQMRFRGKDKMLWNPVLKTLFKNRPEERVRLSLLDYLLLEARFSPSRISFEAPVEVRSKKNKGRTDLICYDRDFNPLLLVECKSNNIKLNEEAALQIARYNTEIGAPFLLVTNGLLDFWFESQKNSSDAPSFLRITSQDDLPELFRPEETIERDQEYWKNRGFLGSGLSSEPIWYPAWANTCREWYSNPLKPIKYLNFDALHEDLPLAGYYRIFDEEDGKKTGLNITAMHTGETAVNVILNHKGNNVGVLSCILNRVSGSEPDVIIHSTKGEHRSKISKYDLIPDPSNTDTLIAVFKKLLSEFS